MLVCGLTAVRKLSRGVLPATTLALACLGGTPLDAIASTACTAVAGNLVANCGFEGGTYSSTINSDTNPSVPIDWTPNAGYDLVPGFNYVISSPSYVNNGTYALSIGNYDDQPAPSISQTLTDSAGTTYTASFYVKYGGAGGGDTGAYFDAQIDGATLKALNDTAVNTYQLETFSFVGTGNDTLSFTASTNPSEWYLDDVSVAAAVPEPSLYLLMLAGFGVLAWRKGRAENRLPQFSAG